MAITTLIYKTHSSSLELHNKRRSRSSPVSPASALGTKNDSHVTIPSNLDGRDHHLNITIKELKNPVQVNQYSNQAKEEVQHVANAQHSVPKFSDERWKNGTWDLNMFVKRGKKDWDAVIVAGEE